jgi:hypothetical protein
MTQTVSLASMVTKVRSYADLVADDFRTDAQIGTIIQARAEQFYEELLRSRCHHWFLKESLLTTVAGTATVTLPTDFLEAAAFDLRLSTTEHRQLEESDFDHRYAYGVSGEPEAWYIAGDSIVLLPTPGAVYTIRCSYIPTLGTLTDAGVTPLQLDSVHGWDEYVCWSVASDIKALQDLDYSYQAARTKEQHERVLKMARSRVPTARKLPQRRYGGVPRRSIYVR